MLAADKIHDCILLSLASDYSSKTKMPNGKTWDLSELTNQLSMFSVLLGSVLK